jgi:sterol desaturase/sphingolipid hydroxylase (fatty acid hydroxylase superfamily)
MNSLPLFAPVLRRRPVRFVAVIVLAVFVSRLIGALPAAALAGVYITADLITEFEQRGRLLRFSGVIVLTVSASHMIGWIPAAALVAVYIIADILTESEQRRR